MTYNNLLTQIEEGILFITINRPSKLNALNMELLQEVGHIFANEVLDDAVKGVIMTGSGEKAFAAGADISEFAQFTVEQGKKLSADGHAIMKSIELCPKPVIAAVNGFALGGGCELAMACHMIIASENAKFGQPEVNLGVIPGYGGTQRLVQRIGRSKGIELLMSGDMISGEEAARLGLANYVVPAEELIEKSKWLINRIAKKSPRAVAEVVKTVDALYRDGMDGFAEEIDAFGRCFGTAEFIEGTTAFMEKRKPSFR